MYIYLRGEGKASVCGAAWITHRRLLREPYPAPYLKGDDGELKGVSSSRVTVWPASAAQPG